MSMQLLIATTRNTADANAQHHRRLFLDEVFPLAQQEEQQLKARLLSSDLRPPGFDQALRRIRVETELYRPHSVPLLAHEEELRQDYERITGARMVIWAGREVPLPELDPVFLSHDQRNREAAWCVATERWLRDRDAINDIWQQCLLNRRELARNAGMGSYLQYRWQQLYRFDYTPDDVKVLHRSVQAAVVPLLRRRHSARRVRMGLERLRPWDLGVDPSHSESPPPFLTAEELIAKSSKVLHQVDRQFGTYFDALNDANRFDLGIRKGKAPGAYFAPCPLSGGFVFMNAAPTRSAVMTFMHECGHVVHHVEMTNLPYAQQRQIPMDFAEVPSMAMELFAGRHLDRAGFYSRADARRALVEHLDNALEALAYNTMVDAFEFWVYENSRAALDPALVDTKWSELRQTFLPEVDWSGLQEALKAGWQTVLILFGHPLHSIYYVFGQLGALQIYANACHAWPTALSAYRSALRLGATKGVPQLFVVAGAKFAFDQHTLNESVNAIESMIRNLEPA
jgi:oligoendopeptidase F